MHLLLCAQVLATSDVEVYHMHGDVFMKHASPDLIRWVGGQKHPVIVEPTTRIKCNFAFMTHTQPMCAVPFAGTLLGVKTA